MYSLDLASGSSINIQRLTALSPYPQISAGRPRLRVISVANALKLPALRFSCHTKRARTETNHSKRIESGLVLNRNNSFPRENKRENRLEDFRHFRTCDRSFVNFRRDCAVAATANTAAAGRVRSRIWAGARRAGRSARGLWSFRAYWS